SGGLDAAEAERLARQAERLGHRVPSRAWVVLMEPDDSRSEAEMAARGFRDRLDSARGDLVRARAPGGLTVVRSASAVIIAPEEAIADLEAAEALGGLVMNTVAPLLKPGSASIGIGNLAQSVAELAPSHLEAPQALRPSKRAGAQARRIQQRQPGPF